MFSNYPAGAENDVNAPYNEKDLDPLKWQGYTGEKDECAHCGRFTYLDDNLHCEECYYDHYPEYAEE